MNTKQRYMMDQDDDCHWYYFPAEKAEEFEKWVEIQGSDDYENPLYGSYPEWLHDVGGHPNNLTFENPQEK